MASYTSYKAKYTGAQIQDGSLTADKFTETTRSTYGVKWIHGCACRCSAGCCCAWVVPANTKNIKFEAWGAGGNGSGACTCSRCQHFQGAGGGGYNTKTITSNPGCTYTVCAGGVYRCLSRECNGCCGCTSYVNGYNLGTFCACGGGRGCANGSWNTLCHSYMSFCRQAGDNAGDFATFNHMGAWSGGGYEYPGGSCHCWTQLSSSTGGMMGLAIGRIDQHISECYMRCGCWSVPYSAGGQNASNTYCNSGCCGQGGTGGSGVVKITYF